MDHPRRKPLRLPDFDYASPGAYFVTICTRDRRCILSDISVESSVGAAISRPPNASPSLRLTSCGEIVEHAICNIPVVYPGLSIDRYVIMPNHIHLLMQIHSDDDGRILSAPTVGMVIGQMKRWASKKAGQALWQKGYYEHVIRNETDYRQVWEYIENNAAKWAEDRYCVQ